MRVVLEQRPGLALIDGQALAHGGFLVVVALEQLAAELRSLGLQPEIVPFTMPGWERGADRVDLLAPLARPLRVAALSYTQPQAAFEAAQADLGVKEATLRAEIARAALASAEEGVRLLTSRYENRLGRMVDLLDAQTALDAARAARIRAENDVRLSRAQRLYATGGLLSFAAPSEKNGKEKIR